VRSSIQTKALQKVGQIARVVPTFENVKAEHSATNLRGWRKIAICGTRARRSCGLICSV
jgi:hypothetical protein